MVNILCFGDSNTFGSIPGGRGRWPLYERWTSVLQDILGENYRIIEEGCGGRTTVWEDNLELDKNGRTALRISLLSHRPLDLVIIMLGTNDLKSRFSLQPEDIAAGAAELGHLVDRFDYGAVHPIPKVLLVSPIHAGEHVETFSGFTHNAYDVSLQLAPLYERHAQDNGWLFLDAAKHAEPSPRDQLHMEKESHHSLAKALAEVILQAFPQA